MSCTKLSSICILAAVVLYPLTFRIPSVHRQPIGLFWSHQQQPADSLSRYLSIPFSACQPINIFHALLQVSSILLLRSFLRTFLCLFLFVTAATLKAQIRSTRFVAEVNCTDSKFTYKYLPLTAISSFIDGILITLLRLPSVILPAPAFSDSVCTHPADADSLVSSNWSDKISTGSIVHSK